jgi:hypothetical protein
MPTEVSDDLDAQEALENLKNELGSWRAVGAHLGVNPGLAWQVAQGKRHSPAVRRALGLPCLVTVAPCPCGEVHTRPCRIGRSKEPELLRHVQRVLVPWLRDAEARRWGTKDASDDCRPTS